MSVAETEHTVGTYHIRLASMRASWFPETVRRIMSDLPDGAEAIIDLSDVHEVDRFSARAFGDALCGAARRGVSLAVAANDATIRRTLLRERVDRWASIASDMSSARRLLGLLET